MPYDFDKQKRAYFDGSNYVTREQLRSLIDKLLDHTKRQATRIAAKYDAGEISADDFERQMRELLKSAHLVAGVVGRGGRERMTFQDWGRIGAKIKWQYGYLAKFAAKLASGVLSKAATAHRARAYVSAVFVSYADGNAAAVKDAVETEEINPDEILVRLVQSSREGCIECSADAAVGWMKPRDMKPIGSRICQDYCLCMLEFSDEV